MSLKIDKMRSERSSPSKFIAATTLYLDRDDNILTQADVDALCKPGWDEDRDRPIPAPGFSGTLLCRKGGTLPLRTAEAYGLAKVREASATSDDGAVTMDAEADARAPAEEEPEAVEEAPKSEGVPDPEPEAAEGSSEVDARMTREELNKIAAAEGIDGEALPSKAAVLDTIEDKRRKGAPQDKSV